jgi:uncharacterized membrane protein
MLVLGAIISAYLTYVHYNINALVCPNSGIISCETVLGSSYAVILGVPLAIYALIWFIVAAVLVQYKNTMLRNLLGVGALGAMAYSFLSMYIIGKICIYCTGIDLILLIYLISVFVKDKDW